MGTRYPEVERFNRTVNGFDPAASQLVFRGGRGGCSRPTAAASGDQWSRRWRTDFASANRRNALPPKSSIFSPRLGFAWTPKMLGTDRNSRRIWNLVDLIPLPTLNQPGFSQRTAMTVTGNNYLTPSATLADPFPNGFLLPAGSRRAPARTWARRSFSTIRTFATRIRSGGSSACSGNCRSTWCWKWPISEATPCTC